MQRSLFPLVGKYLFSFKTINADTLCAYALLAAAFLFYYFSVLRTDYFSTAFLDLNPRPDGVDYYAMAKSLYDNGTSTIRIGLDELPSRYPWGYSILQIPLLSILSKDQEILAPFFTNHLLGALLIAVIFASYYQQNRKLSGGLAVLLLVALPAFTTYARSPMSEISSTLVTTISTIFVLKGLKKNRNSFIYFAAFFLGLGINIRFQLLFFTPILGSMFLVSSDDRIIVKLKHVLLCGLVFIFGASPVLLYNTLVFGSPLSTGYHFWVPSVTAPGVTFSFSYIKNNLLVLWNELFLIGNSYSTSNIYGSGFHYTPGFIFLSACGVRRCFWRRNIFFVALGFITLLISNLLYLFNDTRFYFPLLVLLIFVATNPLEDSLRKALNGQIGFNSVLLFLLFASTIMGFPSAAGYPLRKYTWQFVESVKWPISNNNKAKEYIMAQFIAENYAKDSCIIFSDASAVFLSLFLPKNIAIAPIDNPKDYGSSAKWSFNFDDAQSLVTKGLQKNLPIYAAIKDVNKYDFYLSKLSALTERHWKIVTKEEAPGFIILRLQQ